jgi:hypothetical protein
VPGDAVQVTAPGRGGEQDRTRQAEVRTGEEAYTQMVAADSPAGARACATLGSGSHGCTSTSSDTAPLRSRSATAG